MFSILLILSFTYILFKSYEWYSKRLKKFKTFVRTGIKGPKPSLISGNLYELRQYSDPNIKFNEWFENYGKIFGYFIGDIPVLVINDLELIEKIFVKQNQFCDRPPNPIEAKPFVNSLVYLRGHRWKCIRKSMAPTFKQNKIISSKCLIDCITSCVQKFVEFVERQESEDIVIDVEHRMQSITLDMICKTALSLNEDLNPKTTEELLLSLNEYLNNAMNPIVDLALFFPFLRTVLRFINDYLTAGRMTDMIVRHLSRRIEIFENKEQKSFGTDTNLLTSLLMDYHQKKMTKEEVIANAHIILIAGYETTSTALTFTLYLLAKHQSIQNQLREDISINGYKSQFLEMVWKESLRLYPPVIGFVTRIASEDTEINGIVIEKGTVVQVPVWHIQHDPTFWSNPMDFNPNRFSEENESKINWNSFQAFLLGSRSCIGRHFAKIEAILTISMILTKFKIEFSDRTPDHLEFRCPTGVVLKPKSPLYLRFVAITKNL